jgi:hypothetical protein
LPRVKRWVILATRLARRERRRETAHAEMPIGRGRDDVNVVVRADDYGAVADAAWVTAALVSIGLRSSLQVARGGGDDCRDDRIPLATGLPRDGDEVVHPED